MIPSPRRRPSSSTRAHGSDLTDSMPGSRAAAVAGGGSISPDCGFLSPDCRLVSRSERRVRRRRVAGSDDAPRGRAGVRAGPATVCAPGGAASGGRWAAAAAFGEGARGGAVRAGTGGAATDSVGRAVPAGGDSSAAVGPTPVFIGAGGAGSAGAGSARVDFGRVGRSRGANVLAAIASVAMPAATASVR